MSEKISSNINSSPLQYFKKSSVSFCRKLCFLLITIILTATAFSGCTQTKVIDKASIVTTITAEKVKNNNIYTFFILGDDDKTESVKVEAENLEKSYALAKNKYAPGLSLAKLGYLVVSETTLDNLKNDMEYISRQSIISPKIIVGITDAKTMKNIAKSKQTIEKSKDSIICLKKNNDKVCINALDIFNKFSSSQDNFFLVSHIKYQNNFESVVRKIKNIEK